MAIRHIIIAAFMASACAAHADVISSKTSSATAQSGFLSGWTTSNGASVLGSGAMSGSLSLFGGVAYGSSADQASALMTQASGSLGSNGQTKLFYTNGIEGKYLLGSGHGILAAMLGNSVSVVGSDAGVIVGTGNMSETGAGKASATANVMLDNSVSVIGSDEGVIVGTGNMSEMGAGTASATGMANGMAGASRGLQVVQAASDVPEPSSIALMLIGLAGAGALTRRRSR